MGLRIRASGGMCKRGNNSVGTMKYGEFVN